MWTLFDQGRSIGQEGSEDGEILREEELDEASRICLERGSRSAAFAITCGVYGWMVHTRFFDREDAAVEAYEAMKMALAAIVALIPATGAMDETSTQAVVERIERFVEQFP